MTALQATVRIDDTDVVYEFSFGDETHTFLLTMESLGLIVADGFKEPGNFRVTPFGRKIITRHQQIARSRRRRHVKARKPPREN